MKNYRITLLAALPLMLAACSADDLLDVEQQDGKDGRIPVQLNFSFGKMGEADTRAATNVNNESFSLLTSSNSSSTICLMADDGSGSNYTAHQYNITGASAVTPVAENEIYFPAGGTTVNLYGWYPYNEGGREFSIATDQSEKENYCLSDVLLANKTTSTVNLSNNVVTPANLTFHHVMAKIVLNINAASGTKVTKVQVNNVQPTLTVSTSAGDYYNTSTDAFKSGVLTTSGTATVVTAYNKSAGFTNTTEAIACVIPPQTMAAGSFLTLTLSDESTIQYNLSAEQKFSANTTYNISIQAGVEMVGTEQTIGAWNINKGDVIEVSAQSIDLTTEIGSFKIESGGTYRVTSSDESIISDVNIKSRKVTFRAIANGTAYINISKIHGGTWDDETGEYINGGYISGYTSVQVNVTTNFCTSLDQVKSRINAAASNDDADLPIAYIGYYVDQNGNIDAKGFTLPAYEIGFIAAMSKEDVEVDATGYRIIVLSSSNVVISAGTTLNYLEKRQTPWSETAEITASGVDGFTSYNDAAAMNGLKLTKAMKDVEGAYAFSAAYSEEDVPAGASPWFLPSQGQVILIKSKDEGLRAEFSSRTVGEILSEGTKIDRTIARYWTATEYDATYAGYYEITKKNISTYASDGTSVRHKTKIKDVTSSDAMLVRPIFVY